MARTRMLGPGFFQNELLLELPPLTRLLFAGLWTIADREGRLEDRPKRIKLALLPADDHDVDAALTDLHTAGFIERYRTDTGQFIQITKFAKYQKPHIREAASEIPPPSTTKVGASTDLGMPEASQGEGEHLPRRPVPIPIPVPIPVSDPVPVPDPVPVAVGDAEPPRIGKQRPLREYPRLRIFPWMRDDLLGMLGDHAIEFDLDAWLLRLDASGEVLPPKIWPWLKDRVAADASARGMAPPQVAPTNKRIAGLMAGGEAFLRRVAEQQARDTG